MTEEREPDGFKIAAEQNIISARRDARAKVVRDPALQQFHDTMINAAHNGVLVAITGMLPAVQKAIVNWPEAGQGKSGKTALMVAAHRRQTEIVKHLISIGADVSLVNDMGHAAIHCAVQSGRPEIVKVLLDAGADVNQRSTEGWTPLMDAVGANSAAIVKLLLDRGAHTHILTPHGETIRGRAGRLGYTDISVLIETAQKKRGGEAAAKLVEKGTAETITVSRPLKLKKPSC